METMKFKTNINCGACLKRVTPSLDGTNGIKHWEVDLDNPDKILTVDSEGASADDITNAIKKVGFEIEPA
ncbi:heavy-metal-associated domain-containing protein [Fulvivirga sediminis]|uniref:Heavy-metal-associated domain-containing protein n=1 Tax=Fulvivirga sediminis TaxID=2803949 RepID=A0A937FBY1_9BACT|nr:heavy-metal-associated domain-containing protein [Fulvivirga sediminis]MBL3657648.1 heavy-metal-associated domain-containing protein [Fulvivirga sediminis]